MEHHTQQVRRARAGFSLLEVLIAMTIMGTTLFSIALAMDKASGSFDEGQVDRDLDSKIHRTLDFVTNELVDSGTGTFQESLLAPTGSDTLSFRRSQGFAGGAMQWGPFLRLTLELEQNELDDGVDNNGNGLVDERVAVWLENPGQANERRRVLTRWVAELAEGETFDNTDENGNGLVDEPGLSFELGDGVLDVRLTLQRIGHEGRMVTRSGEVSLRVRN